MRKRKGLLLGAAAASLTAVRATTQEDAIVHDAEYYILQAQLGERWA